MAGSLFANKDTITIDNLLLAVGVMVVVFLVVEVVVLVFCLSARFFRGGRLTETEKRLLRRASFRLVRTEK